ncbi:MAG: PilZ domain-containing protein, partial [Candidatus Omnitrophota bacterium]
MTSEKFGAERRQHVRIKKNYIIRFHEKSNPAVKFEVSQIENISRGGLCFTSTTLFPVNLVLSIELRTPYITDTIYLEGAL